MNHMNQIRPPPAYHISIHTYRYRHIHTRVCCTTEGIGAMNSPLTVQSFSQNLLFKHFIDCLHKALKTDDARFFSKTPIFAKMAEMWSKMRFFGLWRKFISVLGSLYGSKCRRNYFGFFWEDRIEKYQRFQFKAIFENFLIYREV